ncbi:sensor histidine kinase [Alloscardovia venturai]|uniref:histidine kinase n=1 Tax=Alloscardovia venturai TaxID=1769421 RepID=A0ABW2YB19_9BIFI
MDSVMMQAPEKPRKTITYPLALFMAKYAVYMLISVAIILFFTLYGPIGTIIYPANWGEKNVSSLSRELSSLTDSQLKTRNIPAAYHFVIANSSRTIVRTDMNTTDAKSALTQACTSTKLSSVDLTSSTDQKAVCSTTEHGSFVVLTYSVEARFMDRKLRDLLPSAELFIDAFTFGGIGLAIILISARQARLLKKELSKFTTFAKHIEGRNLDAPLANSSIKEVSQTLHAFGTMRGSLKDSLNTQYAMEENQRKHVQALTHDMKTPLTIARGNAELLETTNLTDEQRAYITAILSSVDTMNAYVSHLNHTKLALTEISIEDFIELTMREVSQFCTASHIKLSIVRSSVPLNLHATVRVDTLVWQRILLNILSNSRDHAHTPDQTSLAVSLEFDLIQHNSEITLTITDNGTGFSPDALVHATEWSYAKTSDAGDHQGVGLSSATQSMRNMEGSVTLSNVSNGGAQVMLSLPIRRIS